MANNIAWQKRLKATYIFYILLSLAWLLTSFMVGGYINYYALITLLVFAAQYYYKHKLANLILGIILLPSSIFWLLQFVWEGGKTGFDVFINVMSILSLASLVFSVMLVFGYLKMNFGDD